MDNNDVSSADPANLRFLRRLVTALTLVMIFGVITIVGLLVIRLNDDASPLLVHPELYPLGPDETLTGYAETASGRIIIITDTPEILILSTDGREIAERIPIE
jgi:hypothetical protein